MDQHHVREVSGSLTVYDGDSLLTPQQLQRIVAAVLQALATQQAAADSRSRDTRIGGGCGCNGPTRAA